MHVWNTFTPVRASASHIICIFLLLLLSLRILRRQGRQAMYERAARGTFIQHHYQADFHACRCTWMYLEKSFCAPLLCTPFAAQPASHPPMQTVIFPKIIPTERWRRRERILPFLFLHTAGESCRSSSSSSPTNRTEIRDRNTLLLLLLVPILIPLSVGFCTIWISCRAAAAASYNNALTSTHLILDVCSCECNE